MNRIALCSTIAILCCAGAAYGQPPPPTDTCADAPTLPCGSAYMPLVIDNTGETDDYNSGGGCTFGRESNGPDVAYRVVIPPSGVFGVAVLRDPPPNLDVSIYLIADCAESSATCLQGYDECNPIQHQFTYNNPSSSDFMTAYFIFDSYVESGACEAAEGSALLVYTLTCPPPVPIEEGAWGLIKSIYRE